MRKEHKAKKQAELDLSGWKQVIAKKIPQQMNGSDCGVFTCLYSEYLSRRARFTFSESDIPYFRRRMVYEICKNQILNTITSPAAGSADTASVHDSMDEQDGGGKNLEHTGETEMNLNKESATVNFSPDAPQEMKNAAMNNLNNAEALDRPRLSAPAAPPSVSPASESLQTDEEDTTEVMDDTLLLTQNKSSMKLYRSINKILENITEDDAKEDEVGHGVIESDEEDEDTVDQLKVSKKRKGRLLSDSEESDTEETVKPEEDMDDGSNNADEGEKDYDSEENEVVKPAKAKQKLFDKKGKLRRDFYDVEAELSDEEDGRADVSDDEDEKGLDRFEMEEGDLDEIDEDAERAKVKNMSKAKVYI